MSPRRLGRVTGQVTALHRETNTLDWLPSPSVGFDIPGLAAVVNQEVAVPFQAAYDGDPPPPLSECFFTADGAVCLGPTTGLGEELLHEHFIGFDNATNVGDTGKWNALTTGPGAGAALFPDTGGLGLGCMIVQTRDGGGSGTQSAYKSSGSIKMPTGTEALWIQAKVMAPSVANIEMLAGLVIDPGGPTDYILARYSSGGAAVWELITARASAGSTLNTPYTPAGFAFDVLDLIVSADQGFASMWVNGDGPYTVQTNLPTVSLTPWLRTMTTSGQKQMYVDKLFIDTVPAVVNPATLKLAA